MNVYYAYSHPYPYQVYFDVEYNRAFISQTPRGQQLWRGFEGDGTVKPYLVSLDAVPAPTYGPGVQWHGHGARIVGTSLRDHIVGSQYGSSISGGEGGDRLDGLSRNDRLEGGSGDDLLIGGGGNDTLVGGDGSDRLHGGDGDDVLDGGGGNNLLNGGPGYDVVTHAFSRSGVHVDLSGGDGDRYISIAEVIGSDRNDKLRGDASGNVLRGNNGHDVLEGRSGDDRLYGGYGNDTLHGGAGADRLDGGPGVDVASYQAEAASVHVDMREGARGKGAAAGDSFHSIEVIVGSNHRDRIEGNHESNLMRGGGGNDYLAGRLGDDTVAGGVGDDTLFGGDGSDHLWGSAGADRFVFENQPGRDRVYDFRNNVDEIQLSRGLARSVDDALDQARQIGSHVVFTFDGDTSLVIENAMMSQLGNDILIA